ncbi:MAG: hypothetical protein HY904_06845 [Deltaproteobacteria bacterium]|nr:hypothetical protein [Deltaproteobacteria bacterium]
MATPSPRTLARERLRVNLVVLVLMGLHAAMVARAPLLAGPPQLAALGAYCAALAAFMTVIGTGSAWHLLGAERGAAFPHVVVTGWLLAVASAVVGAGIGWAGAFADTVSERALAASMLSVLPAVFVPSRMVAGMLRGMARAGPRQAPVGVGALVAAAALASGTFGALHPWVRFPAGPPATEREALTYGITAVAVTCILLPTAGFRIARGLRVSGALVPPPPEALWTGLLGVGAMAAVALVVVVTPATVEQWSLARGALGAILGAAGIVAGAAWGAEAAGDG